MDATLVAGHAGGEQEDGNGLGVGLGDAAKAVSAPGPFCIIKTPIFFPLVARE